MSGEEVRRAAVINNHTLMREFIQLKANVCSTDAHLLSPLHYAVWNGSVQCVKLLLMNPHGVDKQGVRTTCVNMQSTMGYTALHLAALDCPATETQEIVLSLLLAGADPKIVDKRGDTAYKIAKDNDNDIFLKAFLEYVDARKGQRDMSIYKAMLDRMKREFCVRIPNTNNPDERVGLSFESTKSLRSKDTGSPGKRSSPSPSPSRSASHSPSARSSSPSKYTSTQSLPSTSAGAGLILATTSTGVQLALPDYVEHLPTRVAEKPMELAVHEHLIGPLTQSGFSDMDGVQGLRCLSFATEQARLNAERRERLVRKAVPQLPHIPISG